ncbi:MAG: phosphoesterase [Acidobacteria bacterium]|nr:MAG: phosphoesterase [Acidobacteriota bacterium]
MSSRNRQLLVIVSAAAAWAALSAVQLEREWLAGDSHIHSHWSADYDETRTPLEPITGVDGRYATPINAHRARLHGLSWMVTTDHGGPNHSKLNLTRAYAELKASREMVPEVLQFYGMELNMPAMDHHTLIIPHSAQEASMLYDIESRFDSQDAWPRDPSHSQEAHARRALEHMKSLPLLPLVFANHPSRSATGVGVYGSDEPREFRNNNNLAPEVYRGMEGAPGHQAGTLTPDGTQKKDADGRPAGFRGGYSRKGAHTFGGFDQMTAIVGGLWDSMLGEGRRFWIVATSDSHAHYTDASRPGSDFWPGEYQKTYVHALRSYQGVLDGLRSGRIFAVAGDLITELNVRAKAGSLTAGLGETLTAERGQSIDLTIQFRDPDTKNWSGDNPRVSHVDLIVGDVGGTSNDLTTDRNPTTRVVARFGEKAWTRERDTYTITTTLPALDRNVYLRVRGTNTQDEEPPMDAQGENPWSDLWFYSNPIFVEVKH